MGLAGRNQSPRNPPISRKEHSQRGEGIHGGLHSLLERYRLILRISRGELNVVTQPKVQGEPGKDSKIVVHEGAPIPCVVRLGYGLILFQAEGNPQQEIGKGIAGFCAGWQLGAAGGPGLTAVESKYAKVIQ